MCIHAVYNIHVCVETVYMLCICMHVVCVIILYACMHPVLRRQQKEQWRTDQVSPANDASRNNLFLFITV